MNEREVKLLVKLLKKFATTKDNDGTEFTARENGIIREICQWVVWYGRDELGMD